jgi:hypothetical protein
MPSGRAPISKTGRAADQDPLAAAPIRILLVVARPEDAACAYIDHRSSSLALVETIEARADWSICRSWSRPPSRT